MRLHEKAVSAATSLTIIFITLITIIAELIAPLKDTLKAITGHHWFTKGVAGIVFFIAAYFTSAHLLNDREMSSTDLIEVVALTIAGGLALFLFFIWHFH